MRSDVKLGVVVALATVLVAGGYFAYRGEDEKPVPVSMDSGGSGNVAPVGASPGGAKESVAQNRQPRGKRQVDARQDRSSPTNARKSPPAKPTAGARKATDTARVKQSSAGVKGGPIAGGQPPSLASKSSDRQRPSPPASTRKQPTVAPKQQSAVARKNEIDRKAKRQSDLELKLRSNREANPKSLPNSGGLARNASTPPRSLTAGPAKSDSSRAGSKSGSGDSVAVDRHRIQSGDTFSSLAKMYYGDEKHADFLARRNPSIANPRRLAVGALVMIPALPDGSQSPTIALQKRKAATVKASGKPSLGKNYTVKSGDTFYGIAKTVLGDASRWRELYNLNKAAVKGDPTRLQVGQVIALPGS